MLTLNELPEALAELQDAKEAKFAAEKAYDAAVETVQLLAEDIEQLLSSISEGL